MFKTPILFIVFNRPEITRKTFNSIRKIKPKYLYVVADGPRANRPDDDVKCKATRDVFLDIDWDCELKTCFRDDNRGCGYGPAEAISWFFEHEELGIILEDDCLANESFYPFCAELLEKYQNDTNIWVISGSNPLKMWYNKEKSYIFSTMGYTWGWATWRRAWVNFDYSAKLWHTNQAKLNVKRTLDNIQYFNHYSAEFDAYFKYEREDVWDFQWYFTRLYHHSYSIIPTVNLVLNIGYDEDATHYANAGNSNVFIPSYKLNFPLSHPKFKIDKLFDWIVFEKFKNQKPKSLLRKTIYKIAKIYTGTN